MERTRRLKEQQTQTQRNLTTLSDKAEPLKLLPALFSDEGRTSSSDWPRRIADQFDPYREFGERREQVRRRWEEFISFMAEKLAKPRSCRGAECDGYVYVWAFNRMDYDTDHFEARACQCPRGRSAQKELERAKKKVELAAQNEKAVSHRRSLMREANFPQGGAFGSVTLASYWHQTPNRRQSYYRELVRWVGYWPNRWPSHIHGGQPFGLVLAGKGGRGKTGLAIAAGRYLIEKHGKSVYFTTVSDFLRLVGTAWARDDGSHYPLIEKMAMVDLLILDDLGRNHRPHREENETGPILSLADVIDARYRTCRPMLVTTNRSEEELEEVVGELNAQRIFDSCRYLEVDGQNLRQKV